MDNFRFSFGIQCYNNTVITKKQKRIYDFVTKYARKHGFAPTLEEMARHFKKAISTIHQHIATLENKGLLQKKVNQPRSVEISKSEPFVKIPLLGTITAGQPVETFPDHRETIAVPKSKIPTNGDVYALRVSGDSMIEENIHDGDIVLVKQQSVAENGQKVVALIDNYDTTLKKFYKERGQVRLQPANAKLEPIIIKRGCEFAIQGIVLDVIREEGSAEIKLPEYKVPEKISIQNPYYKKPRFVLYHGDSLNILSKLPENSVDMIFADPPYNLSNDGFTVHAGRMVSVNKGNWDRSKGFKDDYDFHYKWLEACRRVLKPHGTLWVSGTYHSIYQCGHALQALGYHILNDIAWFKPNASPNLSCRYFTASHETLIWARKEKKAKHIFHYDLMKNGHWPEDNLKKLGLQMRSVWSLGTPRPIEKKFGKHPTQKPEDLLKRIILASTNKGDLVIDPFTGSSTTGIAAYLLGRKFIGIDNELTFLDLSTKRYEELVRNLSLKFAKN